MPLFVYTVYRVALLAGVFGLLLLVGASLPVALLGAIIIASAVSYLALTKPRDAATAWLAARAEARKAGRGERGQSAFARRLAEDEDVEDAADDAR